MSEPPKRTDPTIRMTNASIKIATAITLSAAALLIRTVATAIRPPDDSNKR